MAVVIAPSSGQRPATATGPRPPAWRRLRVRALGWPAVLVLLAFLQSPGLLTFDSRLDLVVDPVGLLERTLTLWDADNGVGGVGNQGFGYLFPVGPFFAAGDLLGIPLWVVQRLWHAVLLVAAYEGLRRLSLRVVGPYAGVAVAAGLLWALSPRMMTVLGPLSTEALPMAMLPWVLLPLLRDGAARPGRAAARSGVAVLLIGATNATATLAVLPAAGLWILTRPWSLRRRARLLGAWCAAVLAACLWWLGPLLLLGRTSPPFLDWIEAAENTTGVIGALAALRGTTHWVAYLSGSGADWPAAQLLAAHPLLVLATAVAGVLGLAGLATRSMPERRWLVLTGAVGLAALTLAHVGAGGGWLGSPFAEPVRDLLDGSLAPFRNVHKADPLLRLALVLGAAHLLVRVLRLARVRPVPAAGPRRAVVLGSRAVPAVVALLVVALATPAWTGELRPGPGFPALPDHWRQAADVLARDAEPGRTLVVPAAGFGRYTWGRSIDEPFQPLESGPWAVRSQVPLTTAGSTRVFDAVEAVLASGRGSPALADLLARSGFSRVLVRNDLDLDAAQAVRPGLVRQALERSPGLRPLTSFGDVRSRSDAVPGGVAAGDTDPPVPALELWQVERPVPLASAVALSGVTGLSGGPEDLLQVLAADVLHPRSPTVLAGDADGTVSPDTWLVTDGLLLRERAFGSVRSPLGPVLEPRQPLEQSRGAQDLLPFDGEGHQTTARAGVAAVRASSTAASAVTGDGRLERQPFAAVDGDLGTWWESATTEGAVGQWVELQLARRVDVPAVSLALRDAPFEVGAPVTHVRLTTDAGSLVTHVQPGEQLQTLPLPPGETQRVRVTVERVDSSLDAGQVGVRELQVPGITPRRTLVAPDDQPDDAEALVWAFRTTDDPVGSCLVLAGEQRCDPALAQGSSEVGALDRTFFVPSATEVDVVGTVLPRPGGADRLLVPLDAPLRVSASSGSLPGSVVAGPQSAVDGDPATSWVAAPDDRAPRLTLRLAAPRTVTGLDLLVADQPAASRPRRVVVTSPAGRRTGTLSPGGSLTFAPLTTDRLSITFDEVEVETSTSEGGVVTPLPVAVAEIALRGGPPGEGVDDETLTGVPCGYGPPVVLDGRRLPTAVLGTAADVRTGRPLLLQVCGSQPRQALAEGEHRVVVRATEEFAPRSLQLDPLPGRPAVPVERTVDVVEREPAQRLLDVGPGGASLLVLPESHNAGWQARLDGERLEPVVVDGWQQGYRLPAGAGGSVRMTFAPDSAYRAFLVVGGLVALALVVVAAAGFRRRPGAEVIASEPARPPGWARRAGAAVLAAVAAVVVGGPVCAAGLVLALVLVRRPAAGGAAAVLLGLAAAAPVVLRGAEPVATVQASAPAQALALLAFGVAAGTALRASWGARRQLDQTPDEVVTP